MKLGKTIENSCVLKILQKAPRTEEGVLRASRESLNLMIEQKNQIDFNLNSIAPSGKVLKFRHDTVKEAICAEEYIFDFEKDIYVQVADRTLVDLLKNGEIKNLLYVSPLDAYLSDVKLESCVLMAGSYNPLHHGHIKLLESAIHATDSSLLGVFELSISNAAKTEIGDRDLYLRIMQFSKDNKPLLITNKPFFREKVNFIYPSSWFCIGADTYKRFFDLKYYESPAQLNEFANFLITNGVKLIVGPRASRTKLDTVDDYLDLVPDVYKSSVKEVENFRVDISSTEIRNSKLFV